MVAGIGCRAGVSAEQVESALAAALGPGRRSLSCIATPTAKGHEPGIIAAAAARGVPLVLISQSDLEAASAATLTHSDHSIAAMNVPSVAEAAALAGAGPASRLLGPRIAVGPVTCALAGVASHAPNAGDAPAVDRTPAVGPATCALACVVARTPVAGCTPIVDVAPAVGHTPANALDTP
jgi:cobalt-precorrin 5A hydrolase